jgi:uncharacterized membrane protein
MNLGRWFTLAGIVLNTVGIFIVAGGILETRRVFLPSSAPILTLTKKEFHRRLQRLNAWWFQLLRPVGRSLEQSWSVGTAVATGNLTSPPTFQGTTDDRLAQLQRAIARHAEELAEVENRLTKETEQREAATNAIRSDLTSARGDLEDKIVRAAAGNLTLEVWGVVFVGLGLLLQAFGVLVR